MAIDTRYQVTPEELKQGVGAGQAGLAAYQARVAKLYSPALAAPVASPAASPASATAAPEAKPVTLPPGTTAPAVSSSELIAQGAPVMTDAEKQAIKDQTRREMQQRIDAVNEMTKVLMQQEEQAGQQRTGQANVLAARGGMVGSTAGFSLGQAADKETAQQKQYVLALQNQKLQEVYGEIDKAAQEAIKTKKEEALGVYKSKIEGVKAQEDKAIQMVTDLGASGKQWSELPSDVQDYLRKTTGLSDFQLTLKAQAALPDSMKPSTHDYITADEQGNAVINHVTWNPMTKKSETITESTGVPYATAAGKELKIVDGVGYLETSPGKLEAVTGKSEKAKLEETKLRAEINKINADVAASESSNAAVTPEVLKGMLNVYQSTGVLPSFGMNGKSPLRAQFYAALGSDGNIVTQAAANKAIRTGLTTALRTQQNLLAANQTAIGTLDKQLTLAQSYSDKVSRTDSPFINKYLLQAKSGVFGDPDTAAFNNIIKTASYEFAKVLSGASASIAGATVSSAADAEEMLNSALAKGQINEVFKLMKDEANFRLRSQEETMNGLKSDLNNIGSLTNEYQNSGTTRMIGPDGNQYDVPNNKVEEFKSAGGHF